MENANPKLKQYLLGNLPAREMEAVDLQIIADAGFEEDLSWAESELMEDYLDDALSPAEAESFERNFLVSPERKAALRQIALLRNYARKAASDLPEAAPDTFFQRLKNLFSLRRHPANAALALLVVALAIGLIWRLGFYNPLGASSPLEKEYAELNRQDFGNLAEYKNLKNVNLVAGAFRGSSATDGIAANELTEQTLFRLALPVEANPADNFQAQIVRDGKVIFAQSKIRFYNNLNGQELRLLLPASLLTKGEYQIKVEREAKDESAAIYNFAVR